MFFKEMVFRLIPEPSDGESKDVFKWRQFVAISIVCMGTAIVVSNALAWGFVGFLYSGFASAASVGALQAQQTEIRASQIEGRILEARERQCVASQEGNAPVMQFMTQQLNNLLWTYHGTTGRTYRLPECGELVVARGGK